MKEGDIDPRDRVSIADPAQEMFCTLNRLDQQDEPGFECNAFRAIRTQGAVEHENSRGRRQKGMSREEEDWIDEDAAAHHGPDD